MRKLVPSTHMFDVPYMELYMSRKQSHSIGDSLNYMLRDAVAACAGSVLGKMSTKSMMSVYKMICPALLPYVAAVR